MTSTDTQPEISQEAARAMLAALRALVAECDGMEIAAGAREGDDLGGGDLLDALRAARRAIAAAEGRAS